MSAWLEYPFNENGSTPTARAQQRPPTKLFDEVSALYFKEHRRAPTTDEQIQSGFNKFLVIIGGDKPIGDITKADCWQYKEAQRTNSTKAIINPQIASSHGANREVLQANGQLWDSSDYSLIERVGFDVAVTAEEENQMGGGFKAGIQVLGISANAGIENGSRSSTVSRIKFSVPVKYPPSQQKKIVEAEMSSGKIPQKLQRSMVGEEDDNPLTNVRHGG